ncbi:MAG: AAA family ATPase [Acidilobaceae archaeon]
MPFLVLVVGTPGVGKSSVGSLLAELLGCVFVEARVVYEEKGALAPDPTGREARVVLAERAGEAVASFAESLSSCAVVADVSPSLWLEHAGEHVALVVLLRLHPLVLKKRLESRGWSSAKILENTLAEAFNVIAEELLDSSSDVVEIDCTGRSALEVVEEVLKSIESWNTGVSIDWLERDPSLVETVSRLVAELDSQKESSTTRGGLS